MLFYNGYNCVKTTDVTPCACWSCTSTNCSVPPCTLSAGTMSGCAQTCKTKQKHTSWERQGGTVSCCVWACASVCVSMCVTWTAQPSISNKSRFRSSMLLAGEINHRHTVHQNISKSLIIMRDEMMMKGWRWLRLFHTSGSVKVYYATTNLSLLTTDSLLLLNLTEAKQF